MDLIRRVLRAIEINPSPGSDKIEIEGYSKDMINYHIDLLNEAGYTTSVPLKLHGHSIIHADITLTWKGYDFLDVSRNDTIWKKAKEKISAISENVPLEIMMMVLTDLIKTKIGLI